MKNRSIQSIFHPSVAVALMASMFSHRSANIKALRSKAIAEGRLSLDHLPKSSRHCPQRIGLAQAGWREAARKRKAKHMTYLRRRNARAQR